MLLEVMPDLATFRDAMQALSTDSSLNNKYLESFQHGKSHDKKALTTATAEVKAFGTYVTQLNHHHGKFLSKMHALRSMDLSRKWITTYV